MSDICIRVFVIDTAIVFYISQKPDDLHFGHGLLSVYVRWNVDIDYINNSIRKFNYHVGLVF